MSANRARTAAALTIVAAATLAIGPTPTGAARGETDGARAFIARVESAEAAVETRHYTLSVEADGPVITGQYAIEVWQRKPSTVLVAVTASSDPEYAGAFFQILDDELTVRDRAGTYRRRLPSDLARLTPALASSLVPLLRDSDVELVRTPPGAAPQVLLRNLAGLPAALGTARVWFDGTSLTPTRFDLDGVLGRVSVRVERAEIGAALPAPVVGEVSPAADDVRSLTVPVTAASGRYVVLALRSGLGVQDHRTLAGLGVRLHDVLTPTSYLAYVPLEIRATVGSLPFVEDVVALRSELRYPPGLARAAAASPEAQLELLLLAYPEAEPAALAAELTSSRAVILDRTSSEWQHAFRLRVPAAAVDALARVDGVKWVQNWPAPRIENDVAAGIIGAQTAWSAGYTGNGQVVAVADTGLDTGDRATLSADFQDKIVTAISYGIGSSWGDPHGHGTHTSGTVLGSGANSSGSQRGIAPDARLVVQAFGVDSRGGLIGIPTDLNELLRASYQAGARIASNSWGSSENIYGAHAQQIDQFVWNNPEMVVVFAAGNGGIDVGGDGVIDPGSLGMQGNMKNGITVGARESLRTAGNTKTYAEWGREPKVDRDWSSEPIGSDRISDDIAGLAAFSSRGPSRDGRIKPDITAPGTNILSARSHHPSAPAPEYPYDDDYHYSSGTSMATPVVAGAAAVLREYLGSAKGATNPSAALVKAILLNSATELTPGQYGRERDRAVFRDTLEATSGWRADSPWKRSGDDPRSGKWTWKYSGGDSGALTMERGIGLVNTSRPIVRFWHRYDISSGDSVPRLCFPLNIAFGLASHIFGARTAAATTSGSARVQASADGGWTWETVASFEGRSGWAQERADLSAFAGRADVRVRFQVSSPSLGSAAEWQIDDVEIGEFGATEIPTRPNWVEGFGGLDLSAAVGPVSFEDLKEGVTTGAARTYTISATTPGRPLSVMLVWSDYPGTPNSKRPLVNDLDLAVIDPSGRRVYPNGLSAADRINNVEQVSVAAVQAGTYRVEIAATSVPMGPQPFALVVHGGELGSASVASGYRAAYQTKLTSVSATLAAPPAPLSVTVTNTGSRTWPAKGKNRVSLSYHLRHATGGELVEEGKRANLRADVPPGRSATVALPIELPRSAGRYVIELDMVDEGGTWFSAEGVATRSIALVVTSGYGAIYTPSKMPAVTPGKVVQLPVTVKNTGAFTWTARGRTPVRLSYRILDEDGKVVVAEGRRVSLASDVKAKGSARLRLPVEAPQVPGRYTLRLDLIREGVAWFSDQGVATKDVSFSVEAVSVSGDRD